MNVLCSYEIDSPLQLGRVIPTVACGIEKDVLQDLQIFMKLKVKKKMEFFVEPLS